MTARAHASPAEFALLAAITLIVATISAWPMARLAVEGVAPGGNLDWSVTQRVLDSPATWRAF